MFFDEANETLELSKLEALQDLRLRELVSRIYDQVPFYRDSLKDAGISPSSFHGLTSLNELPFTFKKDFRDLYPYGLLAVPREQVARFHASSGTTGKPIVTGYTASDLDVFAQVNARSLAAAGAQPGMLLHNAYGYGLFTGGLGIHGGGEALGLTVLPISGGLTERQMRLILDLHPDIITCTPSYGQTLAERFEKRGISPNDLSLSLALLGAEPWTETIRSAVDEGLGVRSTNIYGLTEIIGPGVSQECIEERSGSHIWEDHFLAEIVDPETRDPLPDGHQGVLILTTLTREAQPVLRYWTGDVTSLDRTLCRCGRTHVRMGRIEGRTDDLVILRGVNLYPTQIEEILQQETDASAHYQIILTRPGTLDELELQVEVHSSSLQAWNLTPQDDGELQSHPKLKALQQSIQHLIRDSLGVRVTVTIMAPGALPRSEGGKLSRIVDLRSAESG